MSVVILMVRVIFLSLLAFMHSVNDVVVLVDMVALIEVASLKPWRNRDRPVAPNVQVAFTLL